MNSNFLDASMVILGEGRVMTIEVCSHVGLMISGFDLAPLLLIKISSRFSSHWENFRYFIFFATSLTPCHPSKSILKFLANNATFSVFFRKTWPERLLLQNFNSRNLWPWLNSNFRNNLLQTFDHNQSGFLPKKQFSFLSRGGERRWSMYKWQCCWKMRLLFPLNALEAILFKRSFSFFILIQNSWLMHLWRKGESVPNF